ncbi:hypothetical protein GGR56DRAFT_676618 [Xylariaceae sp. FL0804]|nr:hypothetical protein GGR56DRAFT_676618 [Xylariaceae sp. FL0804]
MGRLGNHRVALGAIASALDLSDGGLLSGPVSLARAGNPGARRGGPARVANPGAR